MVALCIAELNAHVVTTTCGSSPETRWHQSKETTRCANRRKMLCKFRFALISLYDSLWRVSTTTETWDCRRGWREACDGLNTIQGRRVFLFHRLPVYLGIQIIIFLPVPALISDYISKASLQQRMRVAQKHPNKRKKGDEQSTIFLQMQNKQFIAISTSQPLSHSQGSHPDLLTPRGCPRVSEAAWCSSLGELWGVAQTRRHKRGACRFSCWRVRDLVHGAWVEGRGYWVTGCLCMKRGLR